MNLKKNWLLYLVVLAIGIAFVTSYASTRPKPPSEISITQLSEQVVKGTVESITITGNRMDIQLKEGKGKEVTYKEDGVSLTQYGITPDKVTIDIKNNDNNSFWFTLLTTAVLPVILIVFFFWILTRQASAGSNQAFSFGRSRPRLFGGLTKKITFQDVAGSEEAKQELREIVDFLKFPQKFTSIGAEIPKGVMLVGPPGTGKTLLAKAVAGEADVPFFSISGSEFVEMFVGVGASRVRDLFLRAKKNAPCIVFIDEIDAVGRHRGAGLGGSHDEREQTLNQILVEMDGFDTATNVIIMAATNRPDVLDPALLRPGRFDRRVTLDLPDLTERKAILEVHSKNKPLGPDVRLEIIARQTAGTAGAELANILNEAAILSARSNKKQINQPDLEMAVEKVLLGPERRSRVLSAREKKITAYHEAGHALVAHFMPEADPVHKISIVSRGTALGFTWNIPEEDRRLGTRSKFMAEIATLLAGRIAEEEVIGDISTGAASDLERATKIARSMVVFFGMSEKLGPQTYGEKEELVFLGKEIGEQRNYSDKTAQDIDQEIRKIIDEGYKKAERIISEQRGKLEKVAEALLDQEVLEREQFEKLLAEEKK